MSLPTIPTIPENLTQESAVNQLLVSIAMEELALGHILNAEGEKLQYALGTLAGAGGAASSITDVLLINESVADMLSAVAVQEAQLMCKLSIALRSRGGSGRP